jgi:hypothetical protein
MLISKGIVKMVRALAKTVNFSIITHGFQRIGQYPLDAKQCLMNCKKAERKEFDDDMINQMLSVIPGLVDLFLDEDSGGQISEEQMDAVGIPAIANDHRRTMPKDKRSLSQQRAVLLNCPAARTRRKEWIERHRKIVTTNATDLVVDGTNAPIIPSIRKRRAPNRPKTVIDAEKREQEQKRATKKLRHEQTGT